MGWQKWALGKGFIATILTPSFHAFTLTLLSLIFPLSFLLLARLSVAQQLLTFTLDPPPSLIILSLFTNTSPPVIHSLVFFITATALACAFTDRILQPGLRIAWACLCALQLCIGSGVEATIVAGLLPLSVGRVTWLLQALFFVGLHEIMTIWSRAIVRPIVDDTVYGVMKEESGAERVAMGAAFGALWLWRLRNEVEVLGVIVEVKKELLMGATVYDFVCWMIYYMAVTIGGGRLAKGFAWLARLLLCKERHKSFANCCEGNDIV